MLDYLPDKSNITWTGIKLELRFDQYKIKHEIVTKEGIDRGPGMNRGINQNSSEGRCTPNNGNVILENRVLMK